MAKIALLFSGQLRACKANFNNIKTNILDVLNPDVFVHSWSNGQDSHNRIDCTTDEFVNLYAPKMHIFEKENYITHINREPNNKFWIMYYSLFQSYNALKTYEIFQNIKYDIIIRMRTDTNFFDCNLDFIKNIQDNDLYLPRGSDWGGLNDQIGFMGKNVAENYFNVFTNMNIIRSSDSIKNINSPEHILANSIGSNFNVIRVPIRYRLEINNYIDNYSNP